MGVIWGYMGLYRGYIGGSCRDSMGLYRDHVAIKQGYVGIK